MMLGCHTEILLTVMDNKCLRSILLFLSVFIWVSAGQTAMGKEVPKDEEGLVDKIDLQAVSSDTSAISGVWGKCLKSVDTRCYFMDINPSGVTSILTYVSSRDTQFSEDPADKPHCYNKTDRALVRLGTYTYMWEDDLASGTEFNASKFLKIVVRENSMLVFKQEKLELSLPAVSAAERADIVTC